MNGYIRISEAEMVVWIAALLTLYILNDLLDATLVGIVVGWLFNLASTGGMNWFFKQKGDTQANNLQRWLKQGAADLIPFVPAPVVAFIIRTHYHNRTQRENEAAQMAAQTNP